MSDDQRGVLLVATSWHDIGFRHEKLIPFSELADIVDVDDLSDDEIIDAVYDDEYYIPEFRDEAVDISVEITE